MTESESKVSQREVMPQDLLRHYIEARSKVYAGGGDYAPLAKS